MARQNDLKDKKEIFRKKFFVKPVYNNFVVLHPQQKIKLNLLFFSYSMVNCNLLWKLLKVFRMLEM